VTLHVTVERADGERGAVTEIIAAITLAGILNARKLEALGLTLV